MSREMLETKGEAATNTIAHSLFMQIILERTKFRMWKQMLLWIIQVTRHKLFHELAVQISNQSSPAMKKPIVRKQRC